MPEEKDAFKRSELHIMLGNQQESLRPLGKDAKDSRIYTSGTSIVVQQLRLQAPNAEGPSLVPSWGTRDHMLQL